MTAQKEMHGKKPISLVEARKKMSEHKPAARVEGNRGSQAVSSREGGKPGDRKGGR